MKILVFGFSHRRRREKIVLKCLQVTFIKGKIATFNWPAGRSPANYVLGFIVYFSVLQIVQDLQVLQVLRILMSTSEHFLVWNLQY